METKRTAKRWTSAESDMLDAIVAKFGHNNVVHIGRVPLDMWPANRTIGASCFQLNSMGWGTTGMPSENRKFRPSELFEKQTGMADMFRVNQATRKPQKETTTTTTTWLWGLYSKTVKR